MRTILHSWPTNPQNPLFGEIPYHTRFSNFKYLHLEITPSLTLGKKRLMSIGIGPFGGILLNKKQTNITKELFSEQFKEVFKAVPSNIITSYTRLDIGLVVKGAINHHFSEKYFIQLKTDYYLSQRRLNDTLVNRQTFRSNNLRWRAIFVGVGLGFKLGT